MNHPTDDPVWENFNLVPGYSGQKVSFLISSLTPDRVRQCGWCALSTEDTMRGTYAATVATILGRVPGDLVECGVYMGSNAAMMAQAASEDSMFAPKLIHLFDSFVGIPQAGPNDDETITSCIGKGDGTGRLDSTGVSAASVEAVKNNLRGWGFPAELFRYHPGWFQHTVPGSEIGAISVLRLDGDLYESTKVCLDHLGHKVSQGGYIILDDGGVSGAVKAFAEWVAASGVRLRSFKIPGSDPVYHQVATVPV